MREPFLVTMRRYEVTAGIVWLLFYLLLMGDVVGICLRLLGISVNAATLNAVFFVVNFLVTVIIFRRFLAYSLPLAADKPLRFLSGILLGFCIYQGCQVALGILYGAFFPNLWTPNDENIRSIAAQNYQIMWAGAVLLGPLVEETLLRGLVFGNLRNKNRIAAYVVASLVFALMHILGYVMQMNVVTFLLNFILYAVPSIALCAAYEYAGTVWAAIVLHMILNALSMYAL